MYSEPYRLVFLSYLTLSPYHILHGQIWRLVTWVFMPTESNLIFLLIMALFYYQLGMALERTWGTFRFNVYIFGGMIFTVIVHLFCTVFIMQ